MMENGDRKLSGAGTSKKSRSLDINSLYKSVSPREGHKNKRKTIVDDDRDNKVSKKKKKSRKEVSLSTFEAQDDSQGDDESRKILSRSGRADGISLTLDDKDDVIRIPKRRRDFIGRKRYGSNQTSKPQSPSHNDIISPVDHISKLKTSSKKHVPSSNKLGEGESIVPLVKSNGNSSDKILSPSSRNKKELDSYSHTGKNMIQDVREEDDHLVVNNGEASSRKHKTNHKKRKADKLADNSFKKIGDSQDEDEENLEQNAARMLSSRFDPSCTGFSSKSKSSLSAADNGLDFFVPSDSDIVSGSANSVAALESASPDASSRILRPRREFKVKGLNRKRRHFYEVLYKDIDEYWVINRRIKVFWPLDESWYYGLINDYNVKEKLHHVKYDDRDEEWINLKNERFKLLLLPSEVPCRKPSRPSAAKKRDTNERNLSVDDDSVAGNYMDSEPIISWLTRYSQRLKSSSLIGSKKHKTSNHTQTHTESSGTYECLGIGSSKTVMIKSSSDSVLEGGANEMSVQATTSHHKDRRFPVVYYRRRFRKKDEDLEPMEEHDLFSKRLNLHGLRCYFSSAEATTLTVPFIELTEFNFKFHSPIHAIKYAYRAENSWFRHMILLQYGSVVVVWPNVHLEMLLVDDIVGLRSLVFEVCLDQAVEIVSLIFRIFHLPMEKENYVDPQLPYTSVWFKLSCFHGIRKEQLYTFHSFTKNKFAKWSFLDYKLQQYCSSSKTLSISECTHDNINALEGARNHLHKSSSCKKFSMFEGLRNKFMQTNRMGVSKEPCNLAKNKEGFAAPIADDFLVETFSKSALEVASPENPGTTLMKSDNSGINVVHSLCCDGDLVKSTNNLQKGGLNVSEDLILLECHEKNPVDATLETKKCDNNHLELERIANFPQPISSEVHLSVDISAAMSYSSLNSLSVEIPLMEQVERHDIAKTPSSHRPTDLSWNRSSGLNHSSNHTGPKRSVWHQNKNAPTSSSLGGISHVSTDGKTDLFQIAFGHGPKKPRTQVQYTLPSLGLDVSSKRASHGPRGLSYGRIRKSHEKGALDSSKNAVKNMELLACDANVLVTSVDKGWRECGAQVVLELADQNEWKLAVKLSGSAKYSYKAHQFLQPGSTNRYTHAMMWRGGKDWVLEFPERSQWMLFKEMHEECYNRNIRAASVKNIPIPGVRLIEESDDIYTEVPFACNPSKYICQDENDVDMATDPARVLYDMDSEDERWILNKNISLQITGTKCEQIPEELFEKTMDMFEKVSYTKRRENFTSDELEDFMDGIGPMAVVDEIYKHWLLKRQNKGMSLIRHLQPPMWEIYDHQVKEWEKAMTKANNGISSGCHQVKASMQKPPAFAFCLKPRGLEVPNKGPKQRSQRRLPLPALGNNYMGYQDNLHAYGRRSSGSGYGDDKFNLQGNGHEMGDANGSRYATLGGGSSEGGSEWTPGPKLHRSKSKKNGTFPSPINSPRMLGSSSYNQRTSKRNDNGRMSNWNTGFPEWPNQKQQHHCHLFEPLDGKDLDEFRLRDASGAAQHALNMAKLKREKAQRLMHRADLAIQKAAVALMTAETIKAAAKESNGDDDDDDDG
ncbi:uncharacterized protein LOC124926890 isoform X2 [Impatiens glandulifera]|uniref:uncharacterized protein LOC124926890 isoform X2 n=1 Tax=Impatiens glandulifera TaxID=253017 RepID=UPI001FB09856|nr:uncharacterized protein LOC124926890 isoform X2 [Impatiens glandulifera]